MISKEKTNEYASEIAEICRDYNMDYSLQVMNQIIKSSVKAKANINKLFNLTEDNDFRLIRTIRDSDLENLLQKLEKQIAFLFAYEWDWDVPIESFKFDWVNNRVVVKKQEMKISKLLGKITSGEILNNSQKVASIEIGLKRIYQYLNFNWCCLNCVDIARLFEFIKNVNFDFIISTNPVDIMTASYHCSFSSCYKPRGEYSNSVQSFLLDPYTAITYITKHNAPNLKKIGRAWIHMLLPERVFELSKFYGTYPHILERYMRNIFEDIAGVCLKYDMNRTIFSDVLHGVYIDDTDTIVYWDSTHPSNDNTSHAQVEPFSPICLACGDEHSHSPSWNCTACDNVEQCADCGEINDIDLMEYDVDNRLICNNCIENDYFFCNECGYFFSNDVESFNVYDEIMCENCFNDSQYIICSDCGDIIDTNTDEHYQLSDYNARPSQYIDIVCKTCASEYIIECPLCNDVVNRLDFDDVLDCCEFCVNEHHTPCKNCDTMVENNEIRENGGYCNNCYKTQREAI